MWRLDGNSGYLSSEQFSASCNVANPGAGIHGIRLAAGHAISDPLMRVLLPAESQPGSLHIEDSYVRGLDLIATYDDRSCPTLRPQIYWRVLKNNPDILFGIEMILSVQTGLLYSSPEIFTESTIAAPQVLIPQEKEPKQFAAAKLSSDGSKLDLGCNTSLFLYRWTDSPYSYLEMVHPSDCRGVTIQSAGGSAVTTRIQLIADAMEKGVIRRCRVRGCLLPRQNDEALANRCFHEFVDSELPLTT